MNSGGPDVAEAFLLYRALELINTIFNECFAHIIIPELKVLAVSNAAIALFAVIKFSTEIHPVMAIMFSQSASFFIVLLLYMCLVGANFDDSTKCFHTNYKYVMAKLSPDRQKYYNRLAAGCSPFGFRVGRFYVIQKVTIVSALLILLNSTLSLLLTY